MLRIRGKTGKTAAASAVVLGLVMAALLSTALLGSSPAGASPGLRSGVFTQGPYRCGWSADITGSSGNRADFHALLICRDGNGDPPPRIWTKQTIKQLGKSRPIAFDYDEVRYTPYWGAGYYYAWGDLSSSCQKGKRYQGVVTVRLKDADGANYGTKIISTGSAAYICG